MIENYVLNIKKCIDEIMEAEKNKIKEVATKIYESIALYNGVLHVFGTGHSNLLAQDLCYRAGGLVPVNIISNPSITLEFNPVQAAKMEKISGLSNIFLSGTEIKQNEVFFVISTSGCNDVPIEMAIEASKRGAFVVAISSKKYSEFIKKEKNIEKSLFDISDISIDNRVEVGDGCLNNNGVIYGSMSTVLGSLILNSIIVEVISEFKGGVLEIPVFKSNNIPNSQEINMIMLDKYRNRLNYKF